jgi:HlyD family secretion protein
MKINNLYLTWVVLFVVACFLIRSFVQTSQTTIFGTADTEGSVLNFAYPVVVNKVYVRSGTPVKKGDTLMLLERPELDRDATLKNKEIQVTNAEKQARVQDSNKEIEKLRSEFVIKTNDLRAQIQLLEADEKNQIALRKVVNGGKSDSGKSLIAEKITTLRTAIRTEEQRFNLQLQELKQTKAAASTVFESKESTTNEEINFIEEAKGKLVLVSPIDGFVENVLALENQITPQYNPLIKLNPLKPNKIKGFLTESTNVTYRFGDTVEVYSARRPSVKSKAILIGSTPQLIELPARLRKLQTASTWGRELYINLPTDNDFFIGEKMIIRIEGK